MVYNWSDTMHSTMKPILSRSILLVICPRSVVRISSTRSTGEPRRRYFAFCRIILAVWRVRLILCMAVRRRNTRRIRMSRAKVDTSFAVDASVLSQLPLIACNMQNPSEMTIMAASKDVKQSFRYHQPNAYRRTMISIIKIERKMESMIMNVDSHTAHARRGLMHCMRMPQPPGKKSSLVPRSTNMRSAYTATITRKAISTGRESRKTWRRALPPALPLRTIFSLDDGTLFQQNSGMCVWAVVRKLMRFRSRP
mmetsp:Transcript_33697/g.108873  ORF Transcript_33697/g.108873 Transcript_33697/m.108873 type:complete len:253 (+) Transcript_33697:1959-2717(+)